MAEEKATKKKASVKPEDAKEAAKATLQALAGTKSPAVKSSAEIQTRPKAEVTQAVKDKSVAVKEPEKPMMETKAQPEAAKPAPVAKSDAPKTEEKPETKKEADPSKEFVDGIMTEMSLKGASKKRLIKMLGEQLNFDKQKVMFRLKRALITERYAAAHAEAGH